MPKGYVDIEVAKLAHELGVQVDTGNFYTPAGLVWHGSNKNLYTRFKRSHLQGILRDEFKIIVYIIPHKDIQADVNDQVKFCPVIWGKKCFPEYSTWPEAFNAGLLFGLKLLKSNREKNLKNA